MGYQNNSWQKKRILIVDDMEASRTQLIGILHNLGFQDVKDFPDGREAWSALNAEAKSGAPFDIIFSDINMPHMNGLALLKKIRESDIYKETPVIMLSTITEKDIILQAIETGATDYVLKPFDVNLVEKKILHRFAI